MPATIPAGGNGSHGHERRRPAWLYLLLPDLGVLVVASVAFLLMLAPWQQELRIASIDR